MHLSSSRVVCAAAAAATASKREAGGQERAAPTLYLLSSRSWRSSGQRADGAISVLEQREQTISEQNTSDARYTSCTQSDMNTSTHGRTEKHTLGIALQVLLVLPPTMVCSSALRWSCG